LPSVYQNRLYYAALKQPPPSHNILASTPRRDKGEELPEGVKPPKKQIHFFNIDNELVYWNFFLDFGPLNLGQLIRFSQKLNDKMRKFPVVCFYSNTVPAKRANAICLICAWQLLFLHRTPEEAFRGFMPEYNAAAASAVGMTIEDVAVVDAVTAEGGGEHGGSSQPPVSRSQGGVTVAPIVPFHDASPCQCTYDLTVLDCLRGMYKALQCNFFNLDDFNVEEYEYFEQVEVREEIRTNVAFTF
jgi:cell division cycle 14